MDRCKIFPELADHFGYVNLNTHAKVWYPAVRTASFLPHNELLEPSFCMKLVVNCHVAHGELEWSYGGWMEDRSTLWRGSYLEQGKKFLHLGVDFNAPVGTQVALSRSGRVVRVDNDHPDKHGWGTRVFVRLDPEPFVLIYAHIDSLCQVGQAIRAGELAGTIAPPERNGYWYPHVHVQAMTLGRYEQFLLKPDGLDGYGPLREPLAMALEFPDPMRFVDLV